jgi:pimeloyl-ACP methyl ester carboxylesterase
VACRRRWRELTTRYGSPPGQAEAVAAVAGALRASDLLLARQTAEQATELVARLHPAHRLYAIVEVSLPIVLAYYLIAQQAAQCRSLMRHLGVERAHVVGHSSSAHMALQLALDSPEAVQSLGLLEPALPGAFDQAVTDADTFFAQELPGLREWSFGAGGGRTRHPAGARRPGGQEQGGHPVFNQRQELLLAWLPEVEPFVLPGATHLRLHGAGGNSDGRTGVPEATRHLRPSEGAGR